MPLPKCVVIQECCPRDGWQNHPKIISTETKLRYIKKMMDCGARMLEVTSFVNPKIMPQMFDSSEVYAGTTAYSDAMGTTLTVLALNGRGVDDARAAGATHVEFVLSASEEHNLRNSRCTIQASMDIFKTLAHNAGDLQVMLCLPCVFGSPFGDEIPLKRLRWIVEEARSAGVEHFGLADTAGISTPQHTREVLRFLSGYTDMDKVSVHFHDTYGMGIANSYVALEEGITRHDASLSALGGCPFAPGAKGNIATEDLVYLCERMGIETGYDLDALVRTGREMCNEIQAPQGGSLAHTCHT